MASQTAGERLILVRPRALAGCELMAIYDSALRWHYFHERYAFTACISGQSGVHYRGVHAHIAAPSIMILEPGETHYDTYVSKRSCFRVLFIEAYALREWARELRRPALLQYRQPFTTDPKLFRVLNGLCRCIEQHEPAMEQRSRFVEFMLAFASYAQTKLTLAPLGNGKMALELAQAHLRERYADSFDLEELAAIAKLSRFHLVHSFTRYFGLSPSAYQNHIRVERARALLLKGMGSAEVALNVGFADQSHFIRHFKRVMHITPSEYARAGKQLAHRSLLSVSSKLGRPAPPPREARAR